MLQEKSLLVPGGENNFLIVPINYTEQITKYFTDSIVLQRNSEFIKVINFPLK